MNDHIRSIKEIDLDSLTKNRTYYPSPSDWEDQVFYFLMVDRFSDGRETEENRFKVEDFDSILTDGKADEWNQNGSRWCGGTLKGIQSKLDYLQELGMTTLWISPIFKQSTIGSSYHGYGIQDFLSIDPHFGTKEDLKELVEAAHKRDMRVVLDIVLNHTGDVFTYESGMPIWTGEAFDVIGLRNSYGNDVLAFTDDAVDRGFGPDDAVWPLELQTKKAFQRKGKIQNWDNYPEYIEGDFYTLKALNLGAGDIQYFQASDALNALVEVYKYWIAYTDIDGYRVDTVKHMEQGATNYFVNAIQDFTYTLGKTNFYILGEVTGGLNFAYDTLNKTGLNAALGINAIPEKMEQVAKGIINPIEYFSIFTNHSFLGEQEHLWFRDNVLTMFDDHDMVTQSAEWKYRFCAQAETASLLINALFLNTMTLGIPCVYYGTEQGFDGSGGGDIYVREAMFGGKFGAFRSQYKHVFNNESPSFRALKQMLRIRKENAVLRQGRQYLREISGDGMHFGTPHKLGEGRIESIVAWSRIFNGEEVLLAMNTDIANKKEAYVVVDQELNQEHDVFTCMYASSDQYCDKTYVVEKVNERKVIKVEIDKHSCGIFKKVE